jgi:hypothetical protein
MTNGDLQGWSADPFRLHEQRYFSAGQPTKLVRDGTVESYDEPPSDTADPVSALAGSSAHAASGLWQPDGVMSGRNAVGGQAYIRQRQRGRGLRAPRARPATRRRTVLAVAAITLAAFEIVVETQVFGLKSHLASTSEAAFIARSVHRTLAKRTADVVVSGSVHAAGHTFALSGGGEIDFGADAEALTMQMSVSGRPAVEKEIATHGHLYYGLTIDGVSPVRMTSGRDWVQLPVQLSSPASVTSSDPRASLVLLEQHGDTARLVGLENVGDLICKGYAVTPSRQAMMSAAQKEISALKLSSSEASLLRGIAPPTITVWLDAHGVMCQMNLGLQMGGLTGAGAYGNVTETFWFYGTPVRIMAPPSSDVVSYQTLRQEAANSPFDNQSELQLLPQP